MIASWLLIPTATLAPASTTPAPTATPTPSPIATPPTPKPVVKAAPRPVAKPALVANVGDKLDRIAKCESGNDPRKVSSTGKYRGAWQFDLQTWQSNGGTGDPINYSYAEQKRIATNLYNRRGTAPWPVCGSR